MWDAMYVCTWNKLFDWIWWLGPSNGKFLACQLEPTTGLPWESKQEVFFLALPYENQLFPYYHWFYLSMCILCLMCHLTFLNFQQWKLFCSFGILEQPWISIWNMWLKQCCETWWGSWIIISGYLRYGDVHRYHSNA